jgi:hypothetical protein
MTHNTKQLQESPSEKWREQAQKQLKNELIALLSYGHAEDWEYCRKPLEENPFAPRRQI